MPRPKTFKKPTIRNKKYLFRKNLITVYMDRIEGKWVARIYYPNGERAVWTYDSPEELLKDTTEKISKDVRFTKNRRMDKGNASISLLWDEIELILTLIPPTKEFSYLRKKLYKGLDDINKHRKEYYGQISKANKRAAKMVARALKSESEI